MNILITGSKGFIGKNLIANLNQNKNNKILEFNKSTKQKLDSLVKKSDLIYHLAGENISSNKSDFVKNNINLTERICKLIVENKLKTRMIFSSTIQSGNKTIYGKTKKNCEKIIKKYFKNKKNQFLILNIPNVFGKWSKPFHNSFISTFAYQVSREKKVNLVNSERKLRLIYIDDLVKNLVSIKNKKNLNKVNFKYSNIIISSPFAVLNLLKLFYKNDKEKIITNFSTSFVKKLYSTYLYYMPKKLVTQKIFNNTDHRGTFAEILKLGKYGQLSYFSILPGKIRGGHYHHTKTEKFLIIDGAVIFNFKDLYTGKKYSIKVSDKDKKIVTTVPGWVHDINNVSKKTAKLIVWANEVFSKKKPDTYFANMK